MESTSSQPTVKKEKKGLSRMWKKVKAAFKDKETTPATTSGTMQTTPAPQPKDESSKPSEPKAEPSAALEADAAQPTESSEALMQNDIDRRLERARALFKKYDFDLNESEWKWEESKNKRPTERVHKSIRMRVKYTCHSCSTVFGHDKVCVSCQHPRCSQCTRYPPKKPKGKKKAADTAAPDENKPETKYACHECQTGFKEGAEECPNCHHKICERCLKEAVVAVSPPPATAEPEKKPAPSEQAPSEPLPSTTT